MAERDRIQISAVVTEETRKRLQIAAIELDRTQSDIVEVAVNEYLDRLYKKRK